MWDLHKLSLVSATHKHHTASLPYVNTLIPNSDQHQISPSNINAQLSAQVFRIKGMITRDELFRYLNNFSQLALQQMYGDQ